MSQLKQGYKQTKVGVIPEDWEVHTLKDIAKIVDSLHQTPEFSDNGYPMIRVTDIKSGNLDLGNALKVSIEIFKEFTKQYTPKRTDIVLSRVGSYGVSSFVGTDEQFCLGQNTVIISPKQHQKFLYYCLNSTLAQIQIDSYSYGSGYKSLSLKNIKDLLIPLPSPVEQEKIAEILTTWDDAIAKQEELIKAKEEQKKGLMQKLLSGEVRFAGFCDEWHFHKLGDLLDYEQPTNYLVSDTNYDDNFETPVLTAGKTFILGYTNETHGIYKEPLPVIIFDDFTTATQFVDFPFKAKSSAMKILKSKCEHGNIKVIFELLQTIKFQADDHKRYWISEYQDLEVKLPSMPEQEKIAEVLSVADNEINLLKNELEELKLQKKGLMQKLLTGEVRVNI
jgi:type I restriction enzyme S subunit